MLEEKLWYNENNVILSEGEFQMEEIKDLYYQINNRGYLQKHFGKEIWIQVSGHRELNSADCSFWSALIPLEKVNKIFQDIGWDSSIGTQGPGFVQSGSETTYQRIHSDFSSCENIVNYREFYGIKPDYVELVEEFRLLNNLYHNVTTNTYSSISENGECIEVAKIENKTCVYIKLEYLMRYAAARQMALLLFFDMRTKISGGLLENGLSEFSDQYKDDTLYYGIWGAEYSMSDKYVYSVLMGKKIVYPKSIEQCGYWPFEKERQYEDFIIGIDDQGDPRKFTCNPDKLSNYCGANSGSPHYLTPVFFKKEVLQRYLSHPNQYSVEDGYLRCQSLWGIAIDNHHMDYVSVYLGDLGRDLPEQEQNHWLQYNVVTSEKLSEVAFKRDFLCIAADSDISDLKFKSNFSRFQKRWKKKFGWDLFLPLSELDEYNINLLHIPITDSQEEFDHQILSLVKTTIDSLNEKEIFKQLKNTNDLKGGISKFKQWLIELDVEGFEPHIKFLRNLQELRSTGTGHRKGKGYEKIRKEFNLDKDNFNVVFDDILLNVDSLLAFLSNHFLDEM